MISEKRLGNLLLLQYNICIMALKAKHALSHLVTWLESQ